MNEQMVCLELSSSGNEAHMCDKLWQKKGSLTRPSRGTMVRQDVLLRPRREGRWLGIQETRETGQEADVSGDQFGKNLSFLLWARPI